VEADHPNLLLTRRNYAKLLQATGREEDEPNERLEEADTQPEQEDTMGTDEVEAHRLASNTNEEGLADDKEVEPNRLSSNTNEEALADDDEVEAHRLASNTNEEGLADDKEGSRRRRRVATQRLRKGDRPPSLTERGVVGRIATGRPGRFESRRSRPPTLLAKRAAARAGAASARKYSAAKPPLPLLSGETVGADPHDESDVTSCPTRE